MAVQNRGTLAAVAGQPLGVVTLSEVIPVWQPGVAYAAGYILHAPTGGVVQAPPGGVAAAATYTAANWTSLTIDPASIAATYVAFVKNDGTPLTGKKVIVKLTADQTDIADIVVVNA